MKNKIYIIILSINTIIIGITAILLTLEIFELFIVNRHFTNLYVLIGIFIGCLTFILFYFHDKKEINKNE